MLDINNVIRAIDAYLKQHRKDSISPPEANQLLDRKGLLADDKDKTKSGRPLRRLLRGNKLPHAYKVGRYWVIPRIDR